MNRVVTLLFMLLLLGATWICAQAQRVPATPAQVVGGHFNSLNQRILEMARDFPADKYTYRPTPEVRSFGEVIVHVLSGNVYAAKAGNGENVTWDEIDPKTLQTKSQAVAELFARSFVPFHRHEYVDNALSFLEHVAESVPCYRYAFEPDERAVEKILRFND